MNRRAGAEKDRPGASVVTGCLSLMLERFRLVTVIALLVIAVLVDFTGKMMSVISDGVLIGLAIYFAYPLVRKATC